VSQLKTKLLCTSKTVLVFAGLALPIISISSPCLAPFIVQPASAKVASKGKNTVEPSQENFEEGCKRYKDKDMDGAIDSFLQSIYFSRNNYNPQAYYWLGVCYKLKKEDGKAIDAFKHSIDQSMGNAEDAYCDLGEVYMRNNRDQEAEDAFKNAMGQSKFGRRAHNDYGLIMLKHGDLVAAQTHFLDALGDAPWTYTEAWMNLATATMVAKNWGGAVQQFNAILAAQNRLKDVDLQTIYLRIGYCLLQVGNHQGAIDNWHMCLNYNPDNAEAHFELAKLLDREKHFSSAIKEYMEYVRCADEPARVQKVKDRITMLQQYMAAKQVEPQPQPQKQQDDQELQKQADEEAKKQMEDLTPKKIPESGF
jgi:tetratricopeptide (TPR) repeat protein